MVCQSANYVEIVGRIDVLSEMTDKAFEDQERRHRKARRATGAMPGRRKRYMLATTPLAEYFLYGSPRPRSRCSRAWLLHDFGASATARAIEIASVMAVIGHGALLSI